MNPITLFVQQSLYTFGRNSFFDQRVSNDHIKTFHAGIDLNLTLFHIIHILTTCLIFCWCGDRNLWGPIVDFDRLYQRNIYRFAAFQSAYITGLLRSSLLSVHSLSDRSPLGETLRCLSVMIKFRRFSKNSISLSICSYWNR
ncbi:MAG: hypothetical protein ACI901_001095 [Octadecabacter sp.]